ncbi:hypothetical protein GX50_05083 [[Emmonsia] crescens]|uniref:Uncharacterized protein n=1 Tax=[Emmonsia] crescens TaxID=73230 RepID=A0A2B7ZGI0_9EURO|nr:hypothetical protein GX50_05083 [Emmonsia crescens]
MSTAVAPPTVAPLPPMIDHNRDRDRDRDRDRPSALGRDNDSSSSSYPVLAPMSSSHPTSTPSRATADRASGKTSPPDGKRSPNTSRSGGAASKISVKKEPPTSPSLHSSSRHRPRKLDLSASTLAAHSGSTSRGPLTAREGGLAAMHDVGLACLSPGFQTQDPAIREQLQRSISVRDQQRSIIESRLQKTAKGDGPDGIKPSESNLFGSLKTPSSSKKRPPPGLSIVPPSASQFANERVIQSAPLNQTFTGRHHPHPITRHLMNHPSDHHMNSPVHHAAPANQTNNRLPPIADVFGSDALVPRNQDRDHRDWDRDDRNNTHSRNSNTNNNTNGFYQSTSSLNNSTTNSNTNNNNLGPLPSPSLPLNNPTSSSTSSSYTSTTKRPREYRSAEEAVHELAGGREDLLPRIIHYNGSSTNSNAQGNSQNQRHPSPPLPSASANGTQQHPHNSNSLHYHHQQQPQQQQPQQQYPPPTAGRRRTRNEYERDNGSPPLGTGPPEMRFRAAPAPTAHGTTGHGGSPGGHHSHGNNGGAAASGYATGAGAGAGTGGGFGFGAFGAGRDSPETQRRKKEEFLGLCARAWDLFHS